MTDEELQFAFETCSLPHSEWTHRAHVRVAYMYACRHELETAIEQMRRAIQVYNQATNTPEALDRGYHETITQVFMRLIFAVVRQAEPFATSDEFCERHPELLNKNILRRYYSPERLMTMTAKTKFVLPDLLSLPLIAANGLRAG